MCTPSEVIRARGWAFAAFCWGMAAGVALTIVVVRGLS